MRGASAGYKLSHHHLSYRDRSSEVSSAGLPSAAGLTMLLAEDALSIPGGTKGDAQPVLAVSASPPYLQTAVKATALTSDICNTE